jgi:hypothetical protein
MSCARILPVLALLLLLPSGARAVAIDFDDGTGDGDAIGSFYAGLGATFPNGVWFEDMTPAAPRPGVSPPFELRHDTLGSQPTSADPIVIVFSSSVSQVEIDAIDVGFNDARLDAYDAVGGGSLVGFDVYEGTTSLGNEGDADDTDRLSVTAAGIRRVELYQPLAVQGNDGLSFDDLAFTVPEPASWVLLGSNLTALAWIVLRRRARG